MRKIFLDNRVKELRKEIHVPEPGEDGRRHYSWEEDQALLSRLRELKGNKSVHAREFGVSRQAVSKRLERIARDRKKTSKACMLAIEYLFQK